MRRAIDIGNSNSFSAFNPKSVNGFSRAGLNLAGRRAQFERLGNENEQYHLSCGIGGDRVGDLVVFRLALKLRTAG